MKCPKCGVAEWVPKKERDVVVIKTEDFDNHKVRTKFCKKCGKLYRTVEQVE